MKYSEMNAKQQKAYRNVIGASNWIIGGLENTMMDNLPDSDEYKAASKRLADHDGLVRELYEAATSEVYGDGSMYFGASAERYLKDIRFCGKDWIMERCERRIKKMGY